jgi:hypothetical protein
MGTVNVLLKSQGNILNMSTNYSSVKFAWKKYYFERGLHVVSLGFPQNFHFFQLTVFHLLAGGDRYLGWLGGGIVNKYQTELILLVENEPGARLKAGLSHLPCLYIYKNKINT